MYILNLLLAALYRFNFLMRTRGTPTGSARGMLALIIYFYVFLILQWFNVSIFEFPWFTFLALASMFAFLYFKAWDSETIVAFEEELENESEIQFANRILISLLVFPVFLLCLKLLFKW